MKLLKVYLPPYSKVSGNSEKVALNRVGSGEKLSRRHLDGSLLAVCGRLVLQHLLCHPTWQQVVWDCTTSTRGTLKREILSLNRIEVGEKMGRTPVQ